MEYLKEVIEQVNDDAVLTGKEAKAMMHIVREYAEIEIESKKKVAQFLQSIIKHYERKEIAPAK